MMIFDCLDVSNDVQIIAIKDEIDRGNKVCLMNITKGDLSVVPRYTFTGQATEQDGHGLVVSGYTELVDNNIVRID